VPPLPDPLLQRRRGRTSQRTLESMEAHNPSGAPEAYPLPSRGIERGEGWGGEFPLRSTQSFPCHLAKRQKRDLIPSPMASASLPCWLLKTTRTPPEISWSSGWRGCARRDVGRSAARPPVTRARVPAPRRVCQNRPSGTPSGVRNDLPPAGPGVSLRSTPGYPLPTLQVGTIGSPPRTFDTGLRMALASKTG